MKLQEYNGKKIVTLESIGEYITNKEDERNIKNGIYKWLRPHGTKISHPESKKYGQRKYFNYASGLWIFDPEIVAQVILDHWDALDGKFDAEAYADDVSKGEIRTLPDEVVNDNWRVKKKESENNKPKATIKNPLAVLKKAANPEITSVTQDVVPAVNTAANPTVEMPFDQLFALVDIQMEKQAKFISALQESNQKLSEQVTSLVGTVDTLLQMMTTTSVTIKEPKTEIPIEIPVEKSESVIDSAILIKEDASFEEWKKGIKKALDLIMRENPNLTKSSILSGAYNRIREQYGIVWEQEAKEFKNEYGRGPINTQELCWWLETNKRPCKNLLIGKLNTIYGEEKRKAKAS